MKRSTMVDVRRTWNSTRGRQRIVSKILLINTLYFCVIVSNGMRINVLFGLWDNFIAFTKDRHDVFSV